MTIIKRFPFALALTLLTLAINTQAQTPTVSAVNLTPDADKVRISAVGDVFDMSVSVSDESGDVVFESGPVVGDKLDWAMRDSQGQRVPAGSYTLTITYRTSNGKLKRRVEQALVTEVVTAEAKQESTAPAPAAPVEGAGTAGRIAKFTGAATLGNSVMFETSGRIGLGTTAPQQSLHVLGALSRLRLQSTGGSVLTSTEYVNNVGRVWQTGIGGASVAGVASKFFVYDQTANLYRLVIDTAGNLGVGTTTPASRLTVNGGIQILGAGNGIKFADGSIQTKAIAGTINGTGTANRLAKFTGPNSFGNSSVAEVSGNVGIGTTNPDAKLSVTATGDGARVLRLGTERAWVFKQLGTGAETALELTGADPNNNNKHFVINTDGNVGIGTGATPPQAKLDIRGSVAVQNGNVGIGTADPQNLFEVRNKGTSAILQVIDDGTPSGRVRISRLDVPGLGGPDHTASLCAKIPSGEIGLCSSSLRYKTSVRPYAGGLALLSRLRPISFDWKSTGAHDIGLGAEEVAAVEPLLTFKNESGEIQGVKYDQLSAVFINAFKEQQQLIERQGRRIARLEAQLNQVRGAVRRGRAARR